ncbi:MAG: hypothetical protein B5M46_01400 [Epsilonproteobacteria bacterium 4484_20]|nr:MAG: hypothetical protein B5M46_01400 [Epsilonproteobacteria bacterium 4484_20]
MSYLKPLLMSTLTLLLSATLSAQEGVAFDKTFTLEGITFHVTCPNDSSLSKLTIKTKGLEMDDVIEKEIDGTVNGADVADLNGDGAPEIYVFTTSAGSGSYGSVVAYSSNNNKSVSEIYFPEVDLKNKASKGYMGHDEFTIIENRLARRFPVYNDKDRNAKPTGGMRQLTYKLLPGEAAWQLKLVKSTDIK